MKHTVNLLKSHKFINVKIQTVMQTDCVSAPWLFCIDVKTNLQSISMTKSLRASSTHLQCDNFNRGHLRTFNQSETVSSTKNWAYGPHQKLSYFSIIG